MDVKIPRQHIDVLSCQYLTTQSGIHRLGLLIWNANIPNWQAGFLCTYFSWEALQGIISFPILYNLCKCLKKKPYSALRNLLITWHVLWIFQPVGWLLFPSVIKRLVSSMIRPTSLKFDHGSHGVFLQRYALMQGNLSCFSWNNFTGQNGTLINLLGWCWINKEEAQYDCTRKEYTKPSLCADVWKGGPYEWWSHYGLKVLCKV